MSRLPAQQRGWEERPRYREAYPRLDIMLATASFDAGQTICEFTDRRGERNGIARFGRSGDRCRLDYCFYFPQTGHVRHWVEFDLRPVGDGSTPRRVTIPCPVCGSSRKILYFKDAWTCAPCAELLARVQLIPPAVRKWEKFDRLSQDFESGKPHGMHNSTYSRILANIHKIETELYGKPRVYASEKYFEYVSCTWRSTSGGDNFLLPPQPAPEVHPDPRVPCVPLGIRADASSTMPGGYETDDPSRL